MTDSKQITILSGLPVATLEYLRLYRQPSRREIWAGINEADKFYTCCLCGEVIEKEDFQPAYPGGFVAHSGCWQENARLGHKLSLMRSKLMVKLNYVNDGTFFKNETWVNPEKSKYPTHSIVHEMQERQARIQNELK